MTTLTIHRASRRIGGDFVEIEAQDGQRLILETGRPPEAPCDAANLLPKTLDTRAPAAGVLLSRHHHDHWRLIEETPPGWPVYCSRLAGELLRVTANMFGRLPARDCRHWHDDRPLVIGAFRVTPILTDHSTFDACALLIEVDGKRLLYAGDFRPDGHKASLLRRLMTKPPTALDVLLIDGTTLGSRESTRTETELEDDLVALFERTAGRVFVSWSAQDLRRAVTMYRACLRSGRTMVVDPYTAELLQSLADAGRLPQPGGEGLKVVSHGTPPPFHPANRRRTGDDRAPRRGLPISALAQNRHRWVVMIGSSQFESLRANGVQPTAQDAWSLSQWSGHLREPAGQKLANWFEAGGAKAEHLHTCNQASAADLHAFVQAMKPRMLVPIQGLAWDAGTTPFGGIRRLGDGETLSLT